MQVSYYNRCSSLPLVFRGPGPETSELTRHSNLPSPLQGTLIPLCESSRQGSCLQTQSRGGKNEREGKLHYLSTSYVPLTVLVTLPILCHLILPVPREVVTIACIWKRWGCMFSGINTFGHGHTIRKGHNQHSKPW